MSAYNNTSSYDNTNTSNNLMGGQRFDGMNNSATTGYDNTDLNNTSSTGYSTHSTSGVGADTYSGTNTARHDLHHPSGALTGDNYQNFSDSDRTYNNNNTSNYGTNTGTTGYDSTTTDSGYGTGTHTGHTGHSGTTTGTTGYSGTTTDSRISAAPIGNNSSTGASAYDHSSNNMSTSHNHPGESHGPSAISGTMKSTLGSIQHGLGKMTGSASLQAKGEQNKMVGEQEKNAAHPMDTDGNGHVFVRDYGSSNAGSNNYDTNTGRNNY